MSAIMDTRRIITVEDHTVMGGLGTAVAEVVAKSGKACVMRMLGHQDEFSTIGPVSYTHLQGSQPPYSAEFLHPV